MAKHAGRFKLWSKPAQIDVRLSILLLSCQATYVSFPSPRLVASPRRKNPLYIYIYIYDRKILVEIFKETYKYLSYLFYLNGSIFRSLQNDCTRAKTWFCWLYIHSFLRKSFAISDRKFFIMVLKSLWTIAYKVFLAGGGICIAFLRWRSLRLWQRLWECYFENFLRNMILR